MSSSMRIFVTLKCHNSIPAWRLSTASEVSLYWNHIGPPFKTLAHALAYIDQEFPTAIVHQSTLVTEAEADRGWWLVNNSDEPLVYEDTVNDPCLFDIPSDNPYDEPPNKDYIDGNIRFHKFSAKDFFLRSDGDDDS